MYIPPRYRVSDDAAIDAFLREHGLATLVTHGPGGLMATHVPVELDRDAGGARRFAGHVSKANPQWRELEAAGEALLVFLGPHCYVSPTWYDHPNVPTWNYQAVHVSGPVRVIHAAADLTTDLRALAEHYEPPAQPAPRFDLDTMPEGLRASEIKGIVGFVLTATRVEAAFKLSQNRHDADHERIVRELRARGDDASRAIAEAMAAQRPGRGGQR